MGGDARDIRRTMVVEVIVSARAREKGEHITLDQLRLICLLRLEFQHSDANRSVRVISLSVD